MKKIFATVFLLMIVILLGYVGVFYYKNLRGIKPVVFAPPEDIVEIIKEKEVKEAKGEPVDFPLDLPKDFDISIFADNLPNARVMAMDGKGNMWVSKTKEGKVSLLVVENGKVVEKQDVFFDLKRPHGLAFDPQDPYILYIAQEDKISKVRVYSDGKMETIINLAGGGRHYTRTIKFGPDNRLYVSIGSTCDVCNEENQQHAKIFSMNKDGGDFKEYAKGLRNTVFFAWNYIDGKMWGTDMGRDGLGDDLPPDEINIIEEGKNYGWPICYGKNIHDTDFDKNVYIRPPCEAPFEEPSYIDLQAHVAPLGLAFVPEEGWPEEYWYDLLVAYHGSWNRSEPVGYKIARLKLNDKGEFLGEEDFISGWLTPDNRALGRPVDILVQPGGVMYISDDKAGVIYRVTHNVDLSDNVDKTNLIKINNIEFGQEIASPLKITGEARGTWFFEGDFPVRLLDENEKEIAVAIATAKSDWMTEEFVPFEATLEFVKPVSKTGTLVFEKDNPSGRPELDDSLVYSVKF